MFIIGLVRRAIFPDLDVASTRGITLLAIEVLNPFLAGVLASIFAATMSTADSQVLACTAAITDDVAGVESEHATTKW